MTWPPPPQPPDSTGVPLSVRSETCRSMWEVLSSDADETQRSEDTNTEPDRSSRDNFVWFVSEHSVISLMLAVLALGAVFSVTNEMGLTNTNPSEPAQRNVRTQLTKADSGCFEDDPNFFDYSAMQPGSIEADELRARG